MSKIDLYDIGLTEQHANEASLCPGNLCLARVSAQHKGIYKILTENGEIQAEVSGKAHLFRIHSGGVSCCR